MNETTPDHDASTSTDTGRDGAESWGKWLFFTENRTLQALQILWWLWFTAVALLFIAPDPGFNSLSPFLTGVVWWVVVVWRKSLTEAIRVIPGPTWVRFMILGIVFFNVLMESLAVSFQGDLHPNIIVSNFLWLGASVGTLVGWWGLSHMFRYTAIQVFFIYALKGVLIEQNFLIPRTAAEGNWAGLAVLVPFVGVVYAVGVAPVFLLLADELPKPPRSVGVWAILLGVVVPAAMFFVGHWVWVHILALVGLDWLLPAG